ncbi:hypothetical protein AGMMS49574_13020 [Bacteroidia bacterium]|nr:hypothetical protein AGMMS49574_13020 [Bacteroidia bacterium]
MQAQETEEFKPSGTPMVWLISDYKTGLGEHSDEGGFSVGRARLGYKYQATPSVSFTGAMDMKFKDGQRVVNYHYAYLEWMYQNLTIDAGLVPLIQFAVQETFWGRRYIEKSFQDLNDFAYPSDVGLKVRYKFTDWLEVDASIVNGEGLLQLNTNKTNRYGLGATILPLNGVTLRAYLDTYAKFGENKKDIEPNLPIRAANQSSIAFFAGYRNDIFSLGAEYNRQTAKKFVKGNNYSGVSVYARVPISKKFDWFARYDYVDTQTAAGSDYNWSSIVNKTLFISGFEFHPFKALQLSPNYRYVESIFGGGAHYICINLGYKL